MPDNVTQAAPWWGQYAAGVGIALIGAGGLLTEGIRKWRSGYGQAEARKLNADATLAEASALQIAQAGNTRSADFERMLNERTFKNMDMLESQVKHLLELVEMQNTKMDTMESEIVALRKALDDRGRGFPPVCHRCDFFDGHKCTNPSGICKFDELVTEQNDLFDKPKVISDE